MLLEVLVAVALFSVGVVAVLGSIRVSQHAVARSENLVYATWILEEVLGEWSQDPDAEARGDRGAFEYVVETAPWTGPRGDTEQSEPVLDGLELVHVVVSWEERGQSHSVDATEVVVRGAAGESTP